MSDKVEKKPFNPSIGHGFENKKFGEDSILINIEAEGFDALMKNAQVGSSLLLRFNKVTIKGNKHYFVELLPPIEKKNYTKEAPKAPVSSLE